MTQKNNIHAYVAERNLLETVLRNGGGVYLADSPSAASTMQRRCYQFISLWRKQMLHQAQRFNPLVISRDGAQVTFRMREIIPPGKLLTPSGEPTAIVPVVTNGVEPDEVYAPDEFDLDFPIGD